MSQPCYFFLLHFFSCSRPHPDLPSFPTRRSSDLIYGEGNRKRLRAMVLLLRYSGLRIRDAATLRRERVRDGKLLLYMQRSEEHTSELQSRQYLVCRLLLEKKK